MMKNYMLAALAAAPCLVAVAPAATAEDYLALIDAQYETLTEIITILAPVEDKESADAAAVKIEPIVEKIRENIRKTMELGQPNPEVLAELEAGVKQREPLMVKAMQAFYPVMMQLSMTDCYGSEALQKMLMSVAPENAAEEK